VGLPLPFMRRKPQPRHALPPGSSAPTPKRRDGTTIGIILVLVLTSGFVAGTTATFTGTTTNASNEFAAAALSIPTGPKVVPQGNDVKVTWTDAGTADDTGAGYRISQSDFTPQAATCPAGLTYTRLGTSQSGVAGYVDTTASARTNFTDGHVNCYLIQTSYPCCPEGTSPWLSQNTTSVQANPELPVVLGVTLIGRSGTNVGASAGTINANDYFDFTFNQPIDITAAKFPSAADTICTDPASATESIWIGLNGTSTTACPGTGDTVFKGFRLAKMTANSDTGNVTNIARYQIASVAEVLNCSTAPGCFKVRITVGTKLGGTAATVTGNFSTQFTSTAGYLVSVSGALKVCNHGATTGSPFTGFTIITTEPTGGKCTLKNTTAGI
jgi:hypothetical protein